MMTMKALVKAVGTALVLGVLLTSISACQKPEGPAERAGKAVDNAVDEAGRQIEKAGDDIQDAAKEGKK